MFQDARLNESYRLLAALSAPLEKAGREIVGREHGKMQLLASLSRAELCNPLLLGPAGAGKALANGTLIPVNDERGYVPIEALVVGDEVFSDTGAPSTVMGVFPQRKKRAFRVTLKDRTSLVCNDEHLWDARTKDDRRRGRAFRTFTLREIIGRGVKDKDGTNRWTIPVGSALQRMDANVPMNPYALGALIGDGHLSDTGANSSANVLMMSSSDEYVVRRVANTIGAFEVQRSKHKFNWVFLREDPNLSVRGTEVEYVHRCDVDANGELDEVFGRKSVDRRIPRVYFTGSERQRLELLRGLMDTNGTVTGNDRVNVCFSSRSEALIEDVHELLASLGIRSTVVDSDRGEKGLGRSILVKLPDERKTDLFSPPHRLEKIDRHSRRDRRLHKHHDEIAIDCVEDLGHDVEMTCIKVGSPSQLFQAGREHIVTHNTALVQATMADDPARLYLEVDPARMISEAGDGDLMAATLKGFFDDAERFVRAERRELVLFIDEFHQIIQLSGAAVEAIKPVLAASGTRGIRIIAATTYEEFHKHVAPNQPLVERLQRINLTPPDQETTIKILQGMAERYGVADQFYDDFVFRQIYEYTQRYMPANAQPRKSILVLDSMVGWHRLAHRPMDRELLADVLQESLGVNVAFRVDGTQIKKQLDAKVFSQDLATSVVARRLQLSVADLHDPTRPMASLLFTGSTGVGKTELCKQLAKLLFGDDQRHLIRFDCTEYASDESFALFRSELTRRVWNLSHAVLLFDEIEKASPMVTRVLLQVLDDGRLSDDNNREVSFLNAYIVLTTNAGSEIYKTVADYAADDTGSGKQLEGYKKLIRRSISETSAENRFPPELLGRIDAIVPFQPLSLATQEKIVLNKLRSMRQEALVKHNVRVIVDAKVLRYLIDDKGDRDSDAGGARTAVAKMTDEVTTEVATFINEHPSERRLRVDVVGNLVSDDKTLLSSDAHIEVSAVR
ncbi:AAA family ATPase [Streptomyces sp. NPDC056061]|uniref:AAA family ATPase n=1 Tax=Streptomyces sp. NPDC056061 TaxID=3345700 RepID=UPI0035DCD826